MKKMVIVTEKRAQTLEKQDWQDLVNNCPWKSLTGSLGKWEGDTVTNLSKETRRRTCYGIKDY